MLHHSWVWFLCIVCDCVYNTHTHTQALSLASSSSQPQQTSKDTSATPIKTRTEKQERIVRMLQMSLSEKISEKLAAMSGGGGDEGKKGEEGNERSPSPTSTVSSSGEVEGAYSLYTDDDDGSQSGDDGESHVIVM